MASSLRRNLEEQVTCAICYEHYRDPRLLPCLHTYCKQCLDDLVEASRNKGQIACPECREVAQLGPSGTNHFKAHFQMNNLMSLLTISTSETQSGSLSCENCTSNDAAKGRCSDCCALLCDFCLKAHQRFKDTQDHKIMSLEEVKKQGAPAMTQQVKCEKHKGEVKKLYCESCQQLICRDCTIIDHREHKFQFIDEVAGRLVQNLNRNVVNAVQARSKVEGTRKTVREMKEKIKTKCDNTLKEIEDAVQEQIAFLMNKEKELKKEVKKIADNNTKILDEQEKELTKKLNGLDNSIQFTQKVLQDGNNINILSVSSEANSRLVTLTNQVPYIENQPRAQDDFSLQHDRDKIQNVVENGMEIVDIVQGLYKTLYVYGKHNKSRNSYRANR